MSKGNAPQAPDPYAAANAQYQYGTAASDYSTALNRPNTITPYGSNTWSETAQPTGPGYTSTPTSVPNPSGFYSGFFNGVPSNPSAPTPGGTPNFSYFRGVSNTPGGAPNPAGGGPSPPAGGGAAPPPSSTSNQPPAGIVPTAPWTGNQQPTVLQGEGGASLPGPGGYGSEPAQVPPNYTETFNLSPAEQALFNLNQSGELGIGGASAFGANTGGYSTSVPGAADIPAFTNEAQNAAFGQQTQYLDPQFQQQYEQLDAQLRNSGAQPGDPAYNNAMTLFQNQRQQSYTNAFNNAVGAGLSEQQGLFGEELGGAQFGNQAIMAGLGETGFGGAPSFGLGGGSGASSVNAPDLMSAFQNQYAGQLANYNANVSSTNSDIGALAAIGSDIALAYSDRRLKKAIKRIGTTEGGWPAYRFRYRWEPDRAPLRVGVIAQDLLGRLAGAVFADSRGFLLVNYAAVR